MTTPVLMYSKNNCAYCTRAKQLFNRKKISIIEKNVDEHPDLLAEMLDRSGGRRTLPQIFINDKHIGGCDDLYALDQQGKLDILFK